MDFESPDVEKDFPGLYASDPSRQNQDRESDCEQIEVLAILRNNYNFRNWFKK